MLMLALGLAPWSYAISYWSDAVSVRSGDYRLVAKVKGGNILNPELYDLRTDIDTVENVAGAHPDIAERLSAAIR